VSRPELLAALLVIISVGGVGLDVPHPAWFVYEPIIVTTLDTQTPSLLTPVEHVWTVAKAEDRGVVWALFVSGIQSVTPLAIATEDREISVFVVPARYGIIEIPKIPLAKISYDPQRVYFNFSTEDYTVLIAYPGVLNIQVAMGSESLTVPIAVEAGVRTPFKLPLDISVSSKITTAIPGTTVSSASLAVSTQVNIEELTLSVTLPDSGWIVHVVPEHGVNVEALATGWKLTCDNGCTEVKVSLLLSIPESVPPGLYEVQLHVVELAFQENIGIEIQNCLSPMEAVLRWNPATQQMDYINPLPEAPSADQLAWAVVWTELGQRPPQACRPLTREELEQLAEAFAASR